MGKAFVFLSFFVATIVGARTARANEVQERYSQWLSNAANSRPELPPEMHSSNARLVHEFGDFLTAFEYPPNTALVIDGGDHPLYDTSSELAEVLDSDNTLLVYPHPHVFIMALSMIAAQDGHAGFSFSKSFRADGADSRLFGGSGLKIEQLEPTLQRFLETAKTLSKIFVVRVPISYFNTDTGEDEGTRFFLYEFPHLIRYYQVQNVRVILEGTRAQWSKLWKSPAAREHFEVLEKTHSVVIFDSAKSRRYRNCQDILSNVN